MFVSASLVEFNGEDPRNGAYLSDGKPFLGEGFTVPPRVLGAGFSQ